MLGFKAKATAAIILSGIEMVHMMRKRQARYAYNPDPSIAEQFAILAAWRLRQPPRRHFASSLRQNQIRNLAQRTRDNGDQR